jgi:hypothetical protein
MCWYGGPAWRKRAGRNGYGRTKPCTTSSGRWTVCRTTTRRPATSNRRLWPPITTGASCTENTNSLPLARRDRYRKRRIAARPRCRRGPRPASAPLALPGRRPALPRTRIAIRFRSEKHAAAQIGRRSLSRSPATAPSRRYFTLHRLFVHQNTLAWSHNPGRGEAPFSSCWPANRYRDRARVA